MYMKICVVGDVLDIITCANFQYEMFSGYDFTGVEFSIFPIDFEWALQQYRFCRLPLGDTRTQKFFNVRYTSYQVYDSLNNSVSLARNTEFCVVGAEDAS